MYAFSFKHKLLLHMEALPLAPHRASFAFKIKNGSFASGVIVLEELQGRANQENFKLSDASGA
jgi:hypothetical protein